MNPELVTLDRPSSNAVFDQEVLRKQYENPPGKDLKRFWLSWTSWLEEFPETPYFIWQTGSGMDCVLRPSMKCDPFAADLPEKVTIGFRNNVFAYLGMTEQQQAAFDNDDDEKEEGEETPFDRFYVGSAMICAWIDAKSESDAWHLVSRYFPDFKVRFCSERPHGSLSGNAQGGRFGHPVKNAPKRIVFLVDHGKVLGALLDHYGSKSANVRVYEGGGRFVDRLRQGFRHMALAQPFQTKPMIEFLKAEFDFDVEVVGSIDELLRPECAGPSQ